ncbi:MAG: hypothetical protein EB010_10320 [Acidimicrobiia bacterium]|nr:hypothetical protein [Acidimicrobiia bacterium]
MDLILALAPDSAGDRFSRALLHTHAGKKQAALADVEWLIDHLPDHTPEEHLDRLLNWRKEKARQTCQDPDEVCSLDDLHHIAQSLPQTIGALADILGPLTAQSVASDVLTITRQAVTTASQ